MFAHALPTGGLRPAEALPPTLVPNAVLAMAPPAPRRLSFLGACLVYAGGALAFTLAPSLNLMPDVKPHTVPSGVIQDPTLVPAVQLKPDLPPPPPPLKQAGISSPNAPERDKDWQPPTEQVDVPPVAPTSLPTVDRSGESLFKDPNPGPKMPVGATSHVRTDTSGNVGGLVEIDYRQMTILSKVDPLYPLMARHAKIQGAVTLVMTVDERGVPVDVKSLGGPHPTLETEATRVARMWRFEPARVNGQPVMAQFRLTINFRLQ